MPKGDNLRGKKYGGRQADAEGVRIPRAVRISQPCWEAIQQLAEQQQQTASEWILQAIRRRMAEEIK